MDSEVVLKATEAYPAISTRRVSGELGISQFSMVSHVDNIGKSILNCRIELHITKIEQNFWLPPPSKKKKPFLRDFNFIFFCIEIKKKPKI